MRDKLRTDLDEILQLVSGCPPELQSVAVKTPDLQEVPDAHLILLWKFLGWSDGSQYKQLRGCLDLRNASGHPGEYIPDSVKLQSYYADLVQLVLGGTASTAR